MRNVFVLLHRWAGLTTALFLFVSGVTGAVISWDHELDDLLNPHLLTIVSRGGPRLPWVDLVGVAKQRDPRIRATYFKLTPEDGDSASIFVAPRIDPTTQKRFNVDYNQVFMNPETGEELGRRKLGAVWPLNRENFVSSLYRFHYTLHLPEFWGINRWGHWLLGGIAAIWTLDCFIGFYLSLPVRRPRHALASASDPRQRGFWHRWKPAWTIKTGGGAFRVNFDVHRAFGLWTWGLLFVVAFTGFSLNLNQEVFAPALRSFSSYTPSPFEQRRPLPLDRQIEPKLSLTEVVERAAEEGRRRNWQAPVGAVAYSPQYGIYGIRFFEPENDHGPAGAGPPRIYYDAVDGRLLGDRLPWSGSAADIFSQAQFPLHSGRIIGLPGRIVISLVGLVVAALSVTGFAIWWRKREARVSRRRRAREVGRNTWPVGHEVAGE